MVSLVTDYVQDTAAKYLGLGITAVGTLAGNAVGGVGGLIENSGRTVGNGVAGGIGGVGGYINGYGDSLKGSMAADGPVRGGAPRSATQTSARDRQSAVKIPAKKPPGTPAKDREAAVKVPAKTPSSTPAIKATTTKPSMPAAKALPSNRSPAVRTLTTPQSSKAQPKKPSNGKVVISAESRPRKTLERNGDTSKMSAIDKKLNQPPVRSVPPAVKANTKGGHLGV